MSFSSPSRQMKTRHDLTSRRLMHHTPLLNSLEPDKWLEPSLEQCLPWFPDVAQWALALSTAWQARLALALTAGRPLLAVFNSVDARAAFFRAAGPVLDLLGHSELQLLAETTLASCSPGRLPSPADIQTATSSTTAFGRALVHACDTSSCTVAPATAADALNDTFAAPDGPSVLLLCGPTGQGKSTALAAWHEQQRAKPGFHFWHDFSSSSFARAARGMAMRFGMQGGFEGLLDNVNIVHGSYSCSAQHLHDTFDFGPQEELEVCLRWQEPWAEVEVDRALAPVLVPARYLRTQNHNSQAIMHVSYNCQTDESRHRVSLRQGQAVTVLLIQPVTTYVVRSRESGQVGFFPATHTARIIEGHLAPGTDGTGASATAAASTRLFASEPTLASHSLGYDILAAADSTLPSASVANHRRVSQPSSFYAHNPLDPFQPPKGRHRSQSSPRTSREATIPLAPLQASPSPSAAASLPPGSRTAGEKSPSSPRRSPLCSGDYRMRADSFMSDVSSQSRRASLPLIADWAPGTVLASGCPFSVRASKVLYNARLRNSEQVRIVNQKDRCVLVATMHPEGNILAAPVDPINESRRSASLSPRARADSREERPRLGPPGRAGRHSRTRGSSLPDVYKSLKTPPDGLKSKVLSPAARRRHSEQRSISVPTASAASATSSAALASAALTASTASTASAGEENESKPYRVQKRSAILGRQDRGHCYSIPAQFVRAYADANTTKASNKAREVDNDGSSSDEEDEQTLKQLRISFQTKHATGAGTFNCQVRPGDHIVVLDEDYEDAYEVKVLRNGKHFILPASVVVAPEAKARRTWPEEETELIRQALVETILSLCAKEAAGGGIVSMALANVSRCDHLTWRSWAENKLPAALDWLPQPMPANLRLVIELVAPHNDASVQNQRPRPEIGVVYIPKDQLLYPTDVCETWLQSLQPGALSAASHRLEGVVMQPSRCRCARPWDATCTELLRQNKHIQTPLHVLLVAGEAVSLDRTLEEEDEEQEENGTGAAAPPTTAAVVEHILHLLEEQVGEPYSSSYEGDPIVYALVALVCQRLFTVDDGEEDEEDDELDAAQDRTNKLVQPAYVKGSMKAAEQKTPPLSRRSPIPARYSPAPGDRSGVAEQAEAKLQLLKDQAAMLSMLTNHTEPRRGVLSRTHSMNVTVQEADMEEHATTSAARGAAAVPPAPDELDLIDFNDSSSDSEDSEGHRGQTTEMGDAPGRRALRRRETDANLRENFAAVRGELPPDKVVVQGEHQGDSECGSVRGSSGGDAGPVWQFSSFLLCSELGLSAADYCALMDEPMFARLAPFLLGHILRMEGNLFQPLHHDVGLALEARMAMSAEEIRETRVAIAKHAIIRASEILMEDGLPASPAAEDELQRHILEATQQLLYFETMRLTVDDAIREELTGLHGILQNCNFSFGLESLARTKTNQQLSESQKKFCEIRAANATDSHTDERRVRASKALHGASPRSQRRVRFASSESGGKA